MFESKSGSIREVFDVDGWELWLYHYKDGDDMWYIACHNVCGGPISHYPMTHKKNKSPYDEHYYCKKCDIYMPFETQRIINAMSKAIAWRNPIV